MYDMTKIYKSIQILDWSKPLPLSFQYKGLDFYPIWRKGYIVKYQCEDHLGLRHTILPGRYVIENSLHKAYNKMTGGSGNYNHFNYEQVCIVVNFLVQQYGFSLEKVHVTKLEIGVNIEVDHAPMNYIKKLKRVQFTKEPVLMRNKNIVYGKKVPLSQFDFKLYDKTHQTYYQNRKKIDQNIIRFELAYNNITGIKRYAATLADLVNLDNYIALTDILHERFTSLYFYSEYDLSILTSRELDAYYAGSHVDYWSYLKHVNKNTAATKRRKYEKMMRALEPRASDKLLLELRLKCRNKIYELI